MHRLVVSAGDFISRYMSHPWRWLKMRLIKLASGVSLWLKRKVLQLIFASRRFRDFFFVGIDKIYSTIFLFGVILLPAVIFWIGPHPLMSKDLAGQFLTTAAAMIGGAVAIIFSLATFALQTASERYSASIFSAYANSCIERLTFYCLSSFAIAFFVLSLFSGPDYGRLPNWLHEIIPYLSILLIGLSFWLIQIFYADIKRKVNPLAAIVLLKKSLKKQIRFFQKDGKRVSGIVAAPAGVDPENFKKMNLASTYQGLDQHNQQIDQAFNDLFEITRKLIERSEIESARIGLSVITEAVCDYISVRGEAAVILPATTFLAKTTDLNDFIVNNLERYISLGERQIVDGHELVAQYIVKELVKLADCSKDISFVNPDPTRDNPALGVIMGYCTRFIEKAAEQKKLDVLLDGVRGMAKIGESILQKAGDLQFSIWQDGMFDLAMYGILLERDFLIQETQNSWCHLLGVLIRDKKWDASSHLGGALKKIAQLTLIHRQRISGSGIAGGMSVIDVQSAPYQAIKNILVGLAVDYHSFDALERRRIRRIYPELVHEFYGVLRALSEKIKCADDLFIHEIGKTVHSIGGALLDLSHEPEWAEQKAELLKCVDWYANLPTWFAIHAMKIHKNSNFNALLDSIAKIGMQASRLGETKIVCNSIEAIATMAKQGLNKIDDSFGYAEPRIFERACFVGILALKNNQQEAIKLLKISLSEFQREYEKKHAVPVIPADAHYSGPKKNQLLYELYALQNETTGLNPYLLIGDARGEILSLASLEDIGRFITGVAEPLLRD